jgi:site-specific DNA-methyltransferase (adenine-specific)
MDIFAGSGTTLKMAKLNNRKFIGFEISHEYCDVIEKRLENLI